MRTERENKLKCLKSEVVQMETLIQAAMCSELLDKMGERWYTGYSYIESISWYYQEETCYNVYNGLYGKKNTYVNKENKTIITATEWLNRHGVFVPGQEVYVSDISAKVAKDDGDTRTFVCGQVTTKYQGNTNYIRGDFYAISWNYIVSPYPEWEDEPEQVRFCLGDNETMISAESAEAIRELVLKNTATFVNCTS